MRPCKLPQLAAKPLARAARLHLNDMMGLTAQNPWEPELLVSLSGMLKVAG